MRRIEEYLETVLILIEQDGEPAKTNDIARELGVSAPTVTEMLQKLSDEDLLEYKPYHGATLTTKGMQEAQGVHRRHQVLETFLVDFLGLDTPGAHEEACELEHHVSDEVLDRICGLLGHPTTCPDGNKIQRGKCCKSDDYYTVLSEVRAGEECRVKTVSLDKKNREALKARGVHPGARLRVLEAGEMIKIIVQDKTIELDKELAEGVFVHRA